MGKLYTFNPRIMGTVRFSDNTGYVLPTVKFDSVPELLAVLPPTVHDVRLFTPQLLRSEYVSTSSELPFNVPDAIEKFDLPSIRVNNPKFFLRQKKGEIVVSPYRVGTVTVRRNQRLVQTNPVTEIGPTHSNWWWIQERLPYAVPAAESWARKLASAAQPGKSIKTFELKVLYSWNVVRFTASRYESMPSDHPMEYPERPDPTSVVTEAYASVLQAQMDVLTEIVELPQTAAYIHDKAVKAAGLTLRAERKRKRLMREAVKNKWPKAKLLDALASLELQFRYAIMPIVYSVQDAMSLLEEYGYLYKEQRRTMNQLIERSDAYGDWGGNDKITAWVKQKFDPDSVLSRLHSLVGPNPVTTLWEVTTLSFVVDWIVPIGDFLTALTTPNTADETKALISHRHSSYCVAKTLSGLQREIFCETYDRQPINPLDHIGLRVNPSMNWKRWLDASALSWNAVRQKLKQVGVRI